MRPPSKAAPVLPHTSRSSPPQAPREQLHLLDRPSECFRKGLRLVAALRRAWITTLVCSTLTGLAWGQPTGAPTFYPLAVGDYWVYLDFGMMSFPDTITIDAYGDTLIEGQQWIKLHRWSHRYENHGYYVERVDSTGDVQGRGAGGTYRKWRFSDTSATFWQAAGGVMARFDSCVAGEYLGVRGHILYVNYWVPGDTAASMVDAFGEGVGFLNRGWYGCCIDGLPTYLAGARISGRVYGVLGTGYTVLPLQVGNFWEYRADDPLDPSRFRMTVVGDTTMPNERRYFILDGSIFPSEYLRSKGSSLFAYRPGDSSEYKLFDGNAVAGDTIAFLERPMEGGIVLRSSYLDTLVNSWTWEFVYYWGSPAAWYEGVEWKIRDSVGVVWERVEPGNSYHLEGARIGPDTIGTVTGIGPSLGTADPKPEMSQNFPNPFNHSTKIWFAWPVEGRVKLAVYDILGREVAELLDRSLPAGFYEVEFDASALASGVYVYRLTAGDFLQSRKLILVR